MTEPSLQAWIADRNLQEVSDPDGQRQIQFRARAGALTSISALEKRVCETIRGEREKRGLSQQDFAFLLGLDVANYAHLEDSLSPVSVGLLIHICEVLDITPADMLAPVAPYLWSENGPVANLRIALSGELRRFNAATLTDIYSLIGHLPTND